MIVEPKVREYICTTAHPAGCEENVREQIAYVKAQGPKEGVGDRSIHGLWAGIPHHGSLWMSGGDSGDYV